MLWLVLLYGCLGFVCVMVDWMDLELVGWPCDGWDLRCDGRDEESFSQVGYIYVSV